MNFKNIFLGGIVGTIVYFLLGWLFYGVIMPLCITPPPTEGENLVFIFLGCMFFAFLLALVLIHWGSISRWQTGLIAGAIIGLLYSLSWNFMFYSAFETVNCEMFTFDVVASTLMTALTGAAIAITNKTAKSS